MHCHFNFCFQIDFFSNFLPFFCSSYGVDDSFYGDWHRILVLNETLRDFVRKNLKRTDRLLINGEIIYNKYELKDGNIATIASILATRIQKLQSLRRGENQTDTTTTADKAHITV